MRSSFSASRRSVDLVWLFPPLDRAAVSAIRYRCVFCCSTAVCAVQVLSWLFKSWRHVFQVPLFDDVAISVFQVLLWLFK
jgi:hypothetical protein